MVSCNQYLTCNNKTQPKSTKRRHDALIKLSKEKLRLGPANATALTSAHATDLNAESIDSPDVESDRDSPDVESDRDSPDVEYEEYDQEIEHVQDIESDQETDHFIEADQEQEEDASLDVISTLVTTLRRRKRSVPLFWLYFTLLLQGLVG